MKAMKAFSKYVQEAIDICKQAGYDFIILESAGVGQSDASILDCDPIVRNDRRWFLLNWRKLTCWIMLMYSV